MNGSHISIWNAYNPIFSSTIVKWHTGCVWNHCKLVYTVYVNKNQLKFYFTWALHPFYFVFRKNLLTNFFIYGKKWTWVFSFTQKIILNSQTKYLLFIFLTKSLFINTRFMIYIVYMRLYIYVSYVLQNLQIIEERVSLRRFYSLHSSIII